MMDDIYKIYSITSGYLRKRKREIIGKANTWLDIIDVRQKSFKFTFTTSSHRECVINISKPL